MEEMRVAQSFFSQKWQCYIHKVQLNLELSLHSVAVIVIVVNGEHRVVILFVGANRVHQHSSLHSARSIALNFNELNNVLLKTRQNRQLPTNEGRKSGMRNVRL